MTIHSITKEITYSGQYWALCHFSRFVDRGARRIASMCSEEGISHVAFENPYGSSAAVLTNPGRAATVVLEDGRMRYLLKLPADSVIV